MSRRTAQVGDLIRQELDDIIRNDLKDPRIGFFTVTRVDMSKDLRSATAYISVLGTDSERSETIEALESAAGFIRQTIKPRLRMRQIPVFTFRDDRSMEYAQSISDTLRDLRIADEARKSREESEG